MLDFSRDKKPCIVTKLKTFSTKVPLARVSWPSAPSLSSVTVWPGPASTANWRELKSTTTSAAPPVPATPRLISTLRSLALAVRPSMPTKPTLPAVALSVVNLRAVAVLPAGNTSVIRARPNATSDRRRPIAVACPPLRPANASTPLPPIVSKSVLMTVAALASAWFSDTTPSLSMTVSLRFSSANPPDTWKNPNASSVRFALARINRPCEPAILRSSVLLVPVLTVSAVFRSPDVPLLKP